MVPRTNLGNSGVSSRSLVLVDTSHLMGPRSDGARFPAHLAGAMRAAGCRAGDLVVVGATSASARLLAWQLPEGVALRCRRGRGGAVAALYDFAADLGQVARSFDRLVVVSGDRRFVTLVAAARRRGLNVVVVAVPQRRAAQLARVASACVDLPHGRSAPPADWEDRRAPVLDLRDLPARDALVHARMPLGAGQARERRSA